MCLQIQLKLSSRFAPPLSKSRTGVEVSSKLTGQRHELDQWLGLSGTDLSWGTLMTLYVSQEAQRVIRFLSGV